MSTWLRYTVPFLCLPMFLGSACTITSTPLPGGGFTFDAGAFDPDGGSTTPTPDKNPPKTDAAPPVVTCTPSATCDRGRCHCGDGTEAATNGVCMKNGACDVDGACAIACGSAVNLVDLDKACTTGGLECTTSSPSIHCACAQGFGYDAYPVCADNYCSRARQDVCPAACKQNGGWAGCQQSSDCAPVICDCADGHRPIPAVAQCTTQRTCEPSSKLCPSACTSHGGWSGVSTTPVDAGPSGGNPGDSCVHGSDCLPLDCSCNNGQTFHGNHVCISQTCATQADACGFVCQSSGGWSGH